MLNGTIGGIVLNIFESGSCGTVPIRHTRRQIQHIVENIIVVMKHGREVGKLKTPMCENQEAAFPSIVSRKGGEEKRKRRRIMRSQSGGRKTKVSATEEEGCSNPDMACEMGRAPAKDLRETLVQ